MSAGGGDMIKVADVNSEPGLGAPAPGPKLSLLSW